MRVSDIRERRASITQQMRTLHDNAYTEDRDLTDDEDKQFKSLKQQLAQVENQLGRAEVIAEAERSMATAEPVRAGNDGSFENAAMKFNVCRAIAHQLGAHVDAGREIEISQECARRSGKNPRGVYLPMEAFMQKRAILTSGSGGNLYPTQHRDDLYINRLDAYLRVFQLGATKLSDLVGDQDIPRMTAGATAYHVDEHEATTESTPTFDTVTMTPHTIAGETQLSRRMAINGQPSTEQIVINDLARVLGTGINYQAINGTGATVSPDSKTPVGVINTTNVNTQSLSTLNYGNLLSMIAAVDADNALEEGGVMAQAIAGRERGPVGWLTNPHVRKKFMSTARVNGTDSRMIMEDPSELAGYFFTVTTQVPGNPTTSPKVDSSLIFGVWSDLLIGYWSQVDILVNPFHTDVYSKGGVKINAFLDYDVAVRHPESFCVATDLDAA